MMANSLLRRPSATLLAAGIVVVGIPIYFVWRRAARA
jgi:hypothetical protein